ncbi:hypothetical protein VTL71DRAFT_8228 [Oculimacula yallundae]|uniref:RZ-type domain-containing protein n=1 Tax=Oculimacula yallundae TaxID=86028 RepID=A0ABR4CX36_9HELO
MEPHFLNALLPTVEHIISIGDHQQLRPQINNFSLSMESQTSAPYQLDRSQFERLSVGEPGRPPFPVSQLNVQRRMRPQISNLIRATIYPRLVDHESTRNLPDVVGMRHNVFFLDHDNLQDGGSNDTQQKSHSNAWGFNITFALVRHIVRQGTYKSSDIAVLTPYTGQLQSLRAKFRSEFEIVLNDRDEEALVKEGFVDTEVGASDTLASQAVKKPLAKKHMGDLLRHTSPRRSATVDNFQGEETKIVIVSLVRSNKEKKVGFLRTSNRINVLLSRAQHGLYLIGNAETYANVPMWNDVLGLLRADAAVGRQFSLCCPRHPDTEIEASRPEDFERRSPEGGCQLICNQRLDDCGHQCLARCHSDSMHQRTTFIATLPKKLPRSHAALLSRKSYQDVTTLSAFDAPRTSHQKPSDARRLVMLYCSVDILVQALAVVATKRITLVSQLSAIAYASRYVEEASELATTPAHDPTMMVRTVTHVLHHARFNVLILNAHVPATKLVAHVSSAVPGHANIKRCANLLTCGHQCPSICGETCPEEYCQLCSTKQDNRVDLLEMKSYNEIDLDETPIVVLGCGHFFTAETLDGMIGMSQVYDTDGYGEFTCLKDPSSELSKAIPRCPDCNSAIRQHVTQRYKRIINRAVIDEMSKRFIVSGQEGLQKLKLKIEELDQKLESSRAQILGLLDRASKHRTQALTPGAQAEMKKLLLDNNMIAISATSDVTYFRRSTLDRNQPAKKLHDATVYAARQAATLDGEMAGLTITPGIPKPARDRRITLGGFAADLKCRSIILSHLFTITQALNSNAAGAVIKNVGGNPSQQYASFLQDCRTLIEDCKHASLPKLSVESTCYFGKVARALQMYSHASKSDIDKATPVVHEAIALLETAKELCKQPFKDADVLSIAVDNILGLLGKEWYEEVTVAELAAIKQAMVSGSGGIATHSGHWYNCENGHPFAIGECGMPMEQARCIECGARIGGQNHSAVEGVTRADQMER